MRNVWVRWSALSLLDDIASSEYTAKLGDTLSRLLTQTAPKPTPKAAAAKAAPLAKTAKPASKVFRSSPTLRQMMHDYNRPTARLAPIKSSAVGPERGFHLDRVDFINIPSIPGRVLRPSNS